MSRFETAWVESEAALPENQPRVQTVTYPEDCWYDDSCNSALTLTQLPAKTGDAADCYWMEPFAVAPPAASQFLPGVAADAYPTLRAATAACVARSTCAGVYRESKASRWRPVLVANEQAPDFVNAVQPIRIDEFTDATPLFVRRRCATLERAAVQVPIDQLATTHIQARTKVLSDYKADLDAGIERTITAMIQADSSLGTQSILAIADKKMKLQALYTELQSRLASVNNDLLNAKSTQTTRRAM